MDNTAPRLFVRRDGILYCFDGTQPWVLEFKDGVTIEVAAERVTPGFDPMVSVPQENVCLSPDQFLQLPLQTPTVKISRGE